MKIAYYIVVIFTSLALSLSGCFGGKPSTTTQEQNLSSGQIINIMMTVDKMEVALSQIATTKQVTPQVKHFAEYLTHQHQDNLDKLTILTKQWQLQPQTSSDSNSLLQTWKQIQQKLDPLQGSEFDIAFIDAMVDSHQAGLKLIDTKLLPQADTPQLKEFVKQFRKMVANHLQKAIQIQKKLSSQWSEIPSDLKTDLLQ